jgi:hypothetical protein
VTDLYSGTGEGMLAFLDMAGTRGEINPDRAKSLLTTANKVLAVEADNPALINIRELDADALFDRFRMLNRAAYNEGSLDTYRSRFRSAIAMYLAFMDDDKGWRNAGGLPRARSNGSGDEAPRKQVVRRKLPVKKTTAAASNVDTVPAAAAPTAEHRSSQLVAYDLPLRPDLLIRLTLPVRLTMADADRVAKFVKSLAFVQDFDEPSATNIEEAEEE